MYFFQNLSNFKVKIARNSWVQNIKKQKKLWYEIFFIFLLFCKIIDEVKLTITFESKMRFEWDKKHIKEQELLFRLLHTWYGR